VNPAPEQEDHDFKVGGFSVLAQFLG
jgi:hypothetical protein